MSRLLIVDYKIETAHKTINQNMIKCFAKICSVDLLSVNHYFDYLSDSVKKQINIINISTREYNHTPIGNRMHSIDVIHKTRKIIRKKKYDAIIVLTYEIVSFFIMHIHTCKTPLVLIHHNDIDELVNKTKLWIAQRYYMNYHHVVFEKYFKDYLVSMTRINSNHVFVIPHPVSTEFSQVDDPIEYDCIGLCNANSKEWIESIKKSDNLFRENNIRILMRSKEDEKNSESVRFINGFLSDEEYNRYYAITNSVFIAVPPSYKYRLSGSTYDALSRRKVVFTTSRAYGEAYSKQYPGICYFVDNVRELIDGIKKIEYTEREEESFDSFICDHRVSTIEEKCNEMIMEICS